MRKTKGLKLISYLVLVLLLMFGAIACSSSTSEQSNKDSNSNASVPKESDQVQEPEQSPEEKVADFYRGKTIKFIVPYSPGGGYDTIARSLAPYLEKYTGTSVIVENVPGAGGNVGAERLFTSKNDGLTIGIMNNQGMIMTQLFDSGAVNFDISEFSFIGRVTAEPVVMYTSTNSGLNTF